MCSDVGLGLVVAVVLGFLVGLVVDRYFQLHGLETITRWAKRRTWRQWLLIVAGLTLPIGLALHFWC